MKKFLHILLLSSVALLFSGCVWGWGWFVPYSFQPSYHKFKEICQLDPEIYQANGGKIDGKYYNKVLAYFDTNLDSLDWEYIQENLKVNDRGTYWYEFEKYHDRIYQDFTLLFKDNQARRDNIKKIMFYANWDPVRARLGGNEGTGIYFSGDWEDCDYFKYSRGALKQEIKDIRSKNGK